MDGALYLVQLSYPDKLFLSIAVDALLPQPAKLFKGIASKCAYFYQYHYSRYTQLSQLTSPFLVYDFPNIAIQIKNGACIEQAPLL